MTSGADEPQSDSCGTTIRHKGRDYTVAIFHVERGGAVLHSIQITASPTGRNVRVYLDGMEMRCVESR